MTQMAHVAVARRELDTLVVVFERVEDVAEELLRNATDVVQIHLLQLTIVLFQLLQHLASYSSNYACVTTQRVIFSLVSPRALSKYGKPRLGECLHRSS